MEMTEERGRRCVEKTNKQKTIQSKEQRQRNDDERIRTVSGLW